MKKTIKDWLGKSENTIIRYKYQTRITINSYFAYDKLVHNTLTKEKSFLIGQKITDAKADNLDMTIAAGIGLLTGMIDVLWVGEFSLAEAQTIGRNQVNQFVIKVAQFKGYSGNNLEGAIIHLEKKYPNPSDRLIGKFGGTLQHHLRDFSHHLSPIGLIFSILTQFTGEGYGTDVTGKFVHYKIENSVAFGRNFEEKIFMGVINWIFHLVSDMAGSSQSAGQGTGIPGVIVSLLKEASTLPIVKDLKMKYKDQDIGLSLWISKLFNGTAFHHTSHKDVVRLDLRTEIGILNFVAKQSMPVIVNQCLVRAFYLVTRLIKEINSNDINSISKLSNLNPEKFMPRNNRSLARMITISSGVFTVVDTADAVVRAALKNPINKIYFAKHVVVRINFVGIANLAIALSNDGNYIMLDLKENFHNFQLRYSKIKQSLLSIIKKRFKWRLFV